MRIYEKQFYIIYYYQYPFNNFNVTNMIHAVDTVIESVIFSEYSSSSCFQAAFEGNKLAVYPLCSDNLFARLLLVVSFYNAYLLYHVSTVFCIKGHGVLDTPETVIS